MTDIFYSQVEYYFSVSRGQVHECIQHIQDKGSVLTWDFDVMHHDIVFTVFRLAPSIKVATTTSMHLAVKNSATLAAAGTAQTGNL